MRLNPSPIAGGSQAVSARTAAYHSHPLRLSLACCLVVIAAQLSSFAYNGDNITPSTAEELYHQCKQAFSEGDFARATPNIGLFLSLYPESDRAREILFMQAFLQLAIDTAMEMYRFIIERYPDSEWAAKSLFQLGQCYYLQGNYDKALDHYGKIIVSYPKDETYWPARYWKCRSLIAKGDYEEAVGALLSLKDTDSAETGKDMVLLSLGNCYLGMKRYEDATATCRSLIQSMPDSQQIPSAYLMLAMGLQNLDRLEEAETFYQKVAKDHPQSIEAQQARQILQTISPAKDKDKKSAPASSVRSSPYFTIKVGAFSNKRNAMNLTNQLKKKGYTVSIVTASDGSSLCKVMVGKFRTRSAALEAAHKLRTAQELATEVVPLPHTTD